MNTPRADVLAAIISELRSIAGKGVFPRTMNGFADELTPIYEFLRTPAASGVVGEALRILQMRLRGTDMEQEMVRRPGLRDMTIGQYVNFAIAALATQSPEPQK